MLVFIFGFEALAQTHVNREWIDNTGAPDTMIWSKSIAMPGDYLLHIGHTKVPNQPTNALFTYYDAQGNIEWQHTFVDSAQYDYYGVDADYDDNHDIYIVGTAKSNVDITAKIFLIKYDHSGNLIWQEFYHSHVSHEDIATGIYVNKSTGISYISVASKTPTTDFDYLALKFNTNGVLQWDARYDYNNLIDFPISVIQEDNKVFLTGASAMHPTRWQYATVIFSEANGNFQVDYREAVAGVGFDTPSSFIKDDDGYFYITGRTSTDGINYNVRTTKLDSTLNVQWTEIYDFAGQKDEGLSIDIDDNGNVYVGGYVTRAPNVTDLLLLKYDSNGNLVWEHTQASEDPTKEAKATVVQATPDGYLYFAGYEHTKNGGNQRTIIGKYSPNNNTIYQRRTKSFSNGDEMPTGLRISEDKSIFLTTIQNDNQQLEYATRRYTEFTQDPTPYIVNDTAVFRAQEIIVRFKQNATIASAFYPEYQGQRREFGLLDTYLYNFAMRSIDNKLKNHYDNWDEQTPNPAGMKAVKVFKELTPNFTKTVNRLGDTIRVPDFWTTLIVSFPPSLAIEDVYAAFNDLPGIIAYAEPNYFIEQTSTPNDPFYYNNQFSLYEFRPDLYPNSSINVEEAWEIYPEAGRQDIKCGIFDDALTYWHEDFAFANVPSLGVVSKVRDGWDFYAQARLFDVPKNDMHGTWCAGIIGAVRNNEIGIAGIAGGNAVNNYSPASNEYLSDKGMSLYGLTILGDSTIFPDSPMQSVYDAFVTSAIDSNELNYGFGLHVSSNSWQLHPNQGVVFFTDTNFTLLREAMHFVNRAQVTLVTSTGNDGNLAKTVKGNMDDDWVITVGGTGINGRYKGQGNGLPSSIAASFGGNIDLAAPFPSDLIHTTHFTGGYHGNFFGTSASVPHVSGTLGLLMGYLNDTVAAYHNLAPEDCEQILELTADNYENIGQYDNFVGWGKLDAGKAMRLIEKPWNTVHHFGTAFFQNNFEFEQIATNLNVFLRESVQNDSSQWFEKGNYQMNVYHYDATIYHEINDQDTIVAYWPRPSSSNVLEGLINDSLLPRERIVIDYLDRDSCITHGYIYELLDGSGNTIGWLPNDTLAFKPRFEYTILSRDSLAPVAHINEKEEKESTIEIFPNPSSSLHTLRIKGEVGANYKIQAYDFQGREVSKVFSGTLQDEKIELINDLSSLGNGFYVYLIVIGEKNYSVKFIKN